MSEIKFKELICKRNKKGEWYQKTPAFIAGKVYPIKWQFPDMSRCTDNVTYMLENEYGNEQYFKKFNGIKNRPNLGTYFYTTISGIRKLKLSKISEQCSE